MGPFAETASGPVANYISFLYVSHPAVLVRRAISKGIVFLGVEHAVHGKARLRKLCHGRCSNPGILVSRGRCAG